jgi:glycerol kinase
MKRHILSIDQGTTSCRALVFDERGKSIGVGQKEFQQYFPQAGFVEHDAEEILTVQIECIKESVQKAGISGEDIACVGITNQRETTVVWNRETGKPIHKAIVWQCRRTQEIAESLKGDSEWFRQKTGLVPDAYFSGPKIAWILDHVEGARKLAQQGKLAFGTIDTWLIWNLTKEKNHLTEPSNASRTMLFNIHNLDWDSELLDALSVPISMMPKVVPSNANFGSTNEALLGFSAPILGTLGDQQAALFGQGCFDKGQAKCTYGTGAFLLANIGSKAVFSHGMLTTIAWQLENKPQIFALEGAIFIAGAAMQWLRDGLQVIASSDESEALAYSVQSNDGVYFVPALVGLGSPWWDSDVRGVITGITRGTGRAHFVRAALESMAYQVADVSAAMIKNGIPLSQLKIDGGATRNKFLLQFQADVLNIPIIRSGQVEATAWGAGALAGTTHGVIADLEEVTSKRSDDLLISPQSDRTAEYDGWKKALAGAFHTAGKKAPVSSELTGAR